MSAVPTAGSAGQGGLDLPPVIAHRGASGDAPENTLSALRLAHAQGARWVEFDVKLTRDGVPVLFHDDRLERTTDGAGAVAATNWREIKELDAGGWFEVAFRGERVPCLGEALDLAHGLGLGMNVEIKPCPGRATETARAVVETLASHRVASRGAVLLSSFAHACLDLARDMAPGLPRGYLARRLPRCWPEELARYGCATLHLDQRTVRARDIDALRAAGVPVLLYTVNRAERAKALIASGATAVFTDRPGDVLRALGAA